MEQAASPRDVLGGLEVETKELSGLAFSCLPGCGFCCTFPVEVSSAETAALRARRPALKIGTDGTRTLLRLRGGCGACQFLSTGRTCEVYEIRPAHCRFFPFHVYFGRRTEVVVNRSCPGVVASPGGSLAAAAEASLAAADAAVVERNRVESAATHATFRSNCEAQGVWDDIDAIVGKIVGAGPDLLRTELISRTANVSFPALLARSLAAFEEPDVAARPYMVDDEFRWLVFQMRSRRVGVAALSPEGRLDVRETHPLGPWSDLEAGARAALFPHFAELLGRESFAGSVFDRMDEERYERPMAEATRLCAADVATDLLLRASLLAKRRPELEPTLLALEARRFYDSDFLDRPTIGAWL